MKRLLPVSLSLVLLATLPLAGASYEAFPQLKPLLPPVGQHTEIAAFVLDPELFDALDDARANFRIFDSARREVPFLVRLKTPLRSVERLRPFTAPAKVESFRTMESNRIEMLATRDPKQPQPVAIQFESGVRNFEKLVTVSGSHDRQTWTILAANEPIYDYSRFVDVRRDRIPLIGGDFLWYRIEVSNITENKDSPLVEIIRQTRGGGESNETEATSFRREPFRMDRIVFLERQTSVVTGEPATRESDIPNWTLTQDAKQQTLIAFSIPCEPLVAVVLKTDEANFSRAITIEGRLTDQSAWQTLVNGRITSIRAGMIKQDNLELALPAEYRGRQFRLTVHNQDNPPLTFTGLRARCNIYEALFFPKPDTGYRVCFGGTDIPVPQYDVATVLAGIPAGSGTAWSIGTSQPNPEFKRQRSAPMSGKNLLMAALILMVGILVPVIVKLARKIY